MSKKGGEPTDALNGVCCFHSETGTEGGYWAFQETRYIRKNVSRGYCKKCGKWLRKQDGAIQLKRVYLMDEEFQRTGKLTERPDCPDNAHEEEIGEAWDYRGLHVLEDGDRLTIYSKDNPNEIVWSGVVKLRQYPFFTEDASGFWIHADQDGVDRETWAQWFFEEHPATLIRN